MKLVLFNTFALVAAGLCPVPALALADDEALSMVYEEPIEPAQRSNASAVASTAPRLAQTCTLRLAKVEDLRANPANAGGVTFMLAGANSTPLATTSLKSGDGVQWTRGALQSLKSAGFQVTEAPPGATTAPRELSADAGLRLAHAWSAGLNLVSHVVLKVSYRTPAGEFTRQYHGMGTRVNWVNANTEYMSTLNLAFNQIMRNVATDAAALCHGKPLKVADIS